MRAAFVINARNKAAHVARAVKGAITQSYPCLILLSDQDSTDGTYEEMERAAAETPMPMEHRALPSPAEIVLDRDVKEVARHEVRLLRCPVTGSYGMQACNEHIHWLAEQAEGCEWIFQCSADDYSLPDRVRMCMHAYDTLRKQGKDAVALGTNMLMSDPVGGEADRKMSGMAESSYVSAGFGIKNLVFGSCIAAYRRDWLLKVGLKGVNCTVDVYLGFLAACDAGYYVVASPQHVHHMAADVANMGFGGKLRGAEVRGDKEEMARLNELNRFQLFELYLKTKQRQQELYPLAHAQDQGELINMMLSQAVGWYAERDNLHKNGWKPGVM